MIGIILLITLLIGLLALVVVLIYSRQSEVELTDRSVDLGDVLPIQTITEDAIINGNGDITVGYRLFLPEVFTLSESDALYIHERLEALLKMLPAGTVVHQQVPLRAAQPFPDRLYHRLHPFLYTRCEKTEKDRRPAAGAAAPLLFQPSGGGGCAFLM